MLSYDVRTMMICVSISLATNVDMRCTCSWAISVRLVMMGFELNVSCASCPRYMRSKAAGFESDADGS